MTYRCAQITPIRRGMTESRHTGISPHSGGYARGCHGLVHHALRSASGADAQAYRHRERPRPSVWR
jgi:hypothetical protein